jgi:hypothetical protein
VERVFPEAVHGGGCKSADGVKSDSGNTELSSELLSPSKKEIGNECNRGVMVSFKPLDNWVLEIGKSFNDRRVTFVTKFTDVFYT